MFINLSDTQALNTDFVRRMYVDIQGYAEGGTETWALYIEFNSGATINEPLLLVKTKEAAIKELDRITMVINRNRR